MKNKPHTTQIQINFKGLLITEKKKNNYSNNNFNNILGKIILFTTLKEEI